MLLSPEKNKGDAMYSLRKIVTPALAALLMLALPAWSALAQEPAAPAACGR